MSDKSGCQACAKNPAAHSFTYFGTIGVTRYMYTSPARAADYKESPTGMANFKKHLDTMQGVRWAWVFDCAGMEMKHYVSLSYVKELAAILMKDHPHTLETIYIVRPNAWIRSMLSVLTTLFDKGVCKKIRILDGDGIELCGALEAASIRGPPLSWLLGAIRSEPFAYLAGVTLDEQSTV